MVTIWRNMEIYKMRPFGPIRLSIREAYTNVQRKHTHEDHKCPKLNGWGTFGLCRKKEMVQTNHFSETTDSTMFHNVLGTHLKNKKAKPMKTQNVR